MKQEDKNLLLKDLCARLPYNVKIQYQVGNRLPDVKIFNAKQYDELRIGHYTDDWLKCIFKPYLFPLSSMTEEQRNDLTKFVVANGITKENIVYDWYNKNHFDYRGLIPKGLAIDATGLNIY
jgi:hypothetical protein